jgi:hypothetical protein
MPMPKPCFGPHDPFSFYKKREEAKGRKAGETEKEEDK